MTLLKIYALYKQATEGDVRASAPASPTWSAAPSTTPGPPEGQEQGDEAMQEYVDLIESLK
jgi:diazepam-binding inhibitor (GABA receptor modulating acyl-CoA-binding protein)